MLEQSYLPKDYRQRRCTKVKIRHKLTLDLQQRSVPPILHLKQGDSMTRELYLRLTNGTEPWIPPQEDIIYQIAYCKMDHTGGCYDSLPDSTPACCVEDGGLVLQIHPQMLSVAGLVVCELRMLNNQGAQLSTFSFFLDLEPNATANIKSEDYYRFTSLDRLRNDLGDPAELQTEDKTSLVSALNELKKTIRPEDVLCYSPQSLTPEQRAQARENIAASPTVHTHRYRDLKDLPVIPESLPANGGNADTVNGKTAEEIRQDAVLSASKIVNTLLTEAKESGEFDGKDGINGKDGADGKTPVKGVDYFTPEDVASLVQQVLDSLGGVPIFGMVDGNNVITLSGNLAEGVYTLKYEDADGNVTEIGVLNHTVVSEPTYKNWIEYATTAPNSAEIYNGKGYKENTRWSSSSAAESSAPGVYVTGCIPVSGGETVYLKNIRMNKNDTASNVRHICMYDSSTWSSQDIAATNDFNPVWDADGNLTQFTIPNWGFTHFRLNTGYIGEDSILTIDEAIV